MPTNIQALKEQMRRDFENPEGSQVEDAYRGIQKAIAGFLYQTLLSNTKVRSGRLAGGWTFQSSGVGERLNKFRIIPPTEIAELAAFNGVDITIGNEVEYGEEINKQTDFVSLSFAELVSFARARGIGIAIS